MLDELRNFNRNGADLNEMVELSAQARAVETEFAVQGVELPGWFEPVVSSLRREIKAKLIDLKASKLRELKARRSTLATVDEKRTQLDKEIAQLETEQAGV
jgi:hypothetical protein